jgi:hypothetical protein
MNPHFKPIVGALALALVLSTPLTGQTQPIQTASSSSRAKKHFAPGQVWLDSSGQPINAHGGGMLYYAKTYYWYGENKEGRTWMPEANRSWDGYRVDVSGIRCYSSKDLFRWKDRGLVLKATPDDPAADLHPSKVVERPKVAFNPRTRKFIMWLHIDTLDYEAARAGVAEADSPQGPFHYRGSVKPEGADSRDQTLFVDDDSQAYRIYASEWNKATYISLLSEDWLKHSGKYIKVFVGQKLEAHAVLKRGGKYYLLASHVSGWDPNPAFAAVADSLWGPWQELGNPCQGPGADTTFRAQGTYVFPVAGRTDAYIFMADRWNKTDLPSSSYVWLPLHFQNATPRLLWADQWDLSDFDFSHLAVR